MTVSNREMDRLWSRYNPSDIKAGDLVEVNIGTKYKARVIGLDLDMKNKKVYANLKLFDTSKRVPIRVDVADCRRNGV